MRFLLWIISLLLILVSCDNDERIPTVHDNPELVFKIPYGFPDVNPSFNTNKLTRYGVELGEKLFYEKCFSSNNTVSCASCHIPSRAFADHHKQAIGVESRVGEIHRQFRISLL